MFEIKSVIKEKFGPGGTLIRLQSVLTMNLNSEVGVLRFLEEQQPFERLAITEVETKEDKTAYFLELLSKNERPSG